VAQVIAGTLAHLVPLSTTFPKVAVVTTNDTSRLGLFSSTTDLEKGGGNTVVSNPRPSHYSLEVAAKRCCNLSVSQHELYDRLLEMRMSRDALETLKGLALVCS